jgi:DNA adenine methylase
MKAAPFLKWAGGKSQLLSQFREFFPATCTRYYEPFLGGGAVFFFLAPRLAVLSDSNAELINVYQVVKENVEELIAILQRDYSGKNNERDYYRIRDEVDLSGLSPTERAARIIYFNKTCFNGLYRVNRSGKFNVPFGNYRNPKICDAAGLQSASAALQGAQLDVSDFQDAVSQAQQGDLVYFDPPYAPLSPTSNFTSYTKEDFGETEQTRLAQVYRDLAKRDVRVMLSNSAKAQIIELYDGFRIEFVKANRAINANGNGRGPIDEILVMNF